jgi:DNA-directed RNA polymerase specialized sigma24 family protein
MNNKTVLRRNFEAEAFPNIDALWQISLWLTENEDSALKLVKESFVNAYRFWSHSKSQINCRKLLFSSLSDLFFKDINRDTSMPQEFLEKDTDRSFFYEKLRLTKAIPCQVISGAISGLLAEVRFVTLLSIIGGFSYQEIADIAGVETNVVRARLYWGHRLIRKEIEQFLSRPNEHSSKTARAN